MSSILKSLNAYNFPIIQPILMKLVTKSMIYYLSNDTESIIF